MPSDHSFPLPAPLRLPRWPAVLLATGLAACVGKSPASEAPTQAPAAGTPAATPAAAEDEQLAARLQRLRERLEQARIDNHIPGMAVAVVKDDKVIFAEGFGLAEIETKRKATAESVFAVGSTSKAFTSALVAMQVEAGKMKWDESITTYIPEMKLRPWPTKKGGKAPALTVRDMLSHRSGFTRMSMLWFGGALSMDEVLAGASKAEPIAGYNNKFLYNNVTYASAGVAAARTADTTWTAMLQERIFEPLGMGDSNATVDAAQANPNLAQGYRWREITEVHEALPMRKLDAIAPAGAINSTVVDMAQWLRMQLGRGTFEGKTLIAKEHLEETWKSNIEMGGGGLSYGMGWMLGQWQGHRFVEHGGNIDGYAAEVAMAPDDGLGFVMLTNISFTPLQRGSIDLVFDTMLGDAPGEESKADSVDLTPYPGQFIANFGSFTDATFTVAAKDGTLFIDVPGQTNYELKHPDAEGRWEFALTNTIKVYFDTPKDGQPQVLHMMQGGMDFEIPRKGYHPPPDFKREEVATKLGRYKSEDGRVAATIKLVDGRLTADVDGQMAFALRKPNEKGQWHFRARDEIAVSFRESKAGVVDALVVHEAADAETKVLLRVKTKDKPLPTVEQLLAKAKTKSQVKRLTRLGPIEISGTISMPSSAVEGRFSIVFDAEGRHRADIDLGKHGKIVDLFDGKEAWSYSTLSVPTQALGKYLRQSQLANPMLVGDWRRGIEDVSVDGVVKQDDKELVKVVLRPKDLPQLEFHIDPTNGEIRRSRQVQLNEGVGGIPSRGTAEDYRTVLGLRIPHRLVTRNEPSGETIFEVKTVRKAKGDAATLYAAPTDL
ncbi:MAG: beta-lactamase family protein [Deltaproteobacteria bacterium]|nr:beta-lactamase family protein [Deltaproteobacteria bacterium]